VNVLCLDLEGVLIPEIWQAVADRTGIEELRKTTRDIPVYDDLMQLRLGVLARNDLPLSLIQEVIESLQPQPIPAEPLSLAFARREHEHVAARDLLFFDTETTGLAGGTGTRAFMIGAADWHVCPQRGEGLRIRTPYMGSFEFREDDASRGDP